MTPLRSEIRHGPVTAGLPLLIGLQLFVAWRWLWPDSAVWINASSAIVAGTMLTGPIAAGLAAWAGTRERRRRTAYLADGAAGSQIRPLALELAAIVSVVTVGYLIATIIILVKVWTGATWGGPNWLWLATGLASELAAAVSGYVAARLLPRVWLPPVVAFAWYLVDVSAELHATRPISFLTPGQIRTVSLFRPIDSVLIGGQLIWYVGVALLLIAVALLVKRVGGGWTRLATTMVAVAATACGVGIVMGQHGHLLKAPSAITYACSRTAPVVCVHPAMRQALPELVPLFYALHERVAGTPADFTTVVQLDRDSAMHPPPGAGRFALDSLGAGDIKYTLVDYLDAIGIGGAGCVVPGRSPSGRSVYILSPSAAELSLVRAWLIDDTGQLALSVRDQSVRWFVQLTEEQRRAWFRTHYQEIANCTLQYSAFGGG